MNRFFSVHKRNTTRSYNFCLFLGSHDRAVLLYDYVGKKTVDLQHTEVPDAYRGRGIAKHLAKVKLLDRLFLIQYERNLFNII